MRRALSFARLLPVILPVVCLEADHAPTFTTRPIGTRALAGHTLSLVGASGDPLAVTSWEKDGEPMPGRRGAKLEFPHVMPGDTGHYRAVLRNEEPPSETGAPRIGESASAEIPLTILVPPERPGVIDLEFAPSGLSIDTVHALLPAPDGGVLVAAELDNKDHPSVILLQSNGAPNPQFSSHLEAEGFIRALCAHEEGWIVGGNFTKFGGQSRQSIARIKADGSLDPNFNPPRLMTHLNEPQSVTCIVLQLVNDRPCLLVGLTHAPFLQRLNPDGSRDEAFKAAINATGLPGKVNAIALDREGRIVLGGNFFLPDPSVWPFKGLGRLTAEGRTDYSFLPVPYHHPDNEVKTLAIDGNERIVIGGSFETITDNKRINGVNDPGTPDFASEFCARYLSNGLVDRGFRPEPNQQVTTLTLLADNSVIMGGYFDRIDGFSSHTIYRVNSDGNGVFRPDSNGGRPVPYWHNASFNDDVTVVAAGHGGRVFVGGKFESPRHRLVAIRGLPFNQPARFLSFPTAQTLALGMGGSVVVAAQAPPTYQYQWFREGQITPFQATPTGEWIIPIVQANHEDTYRVDLIRSGETGIIERVTGPLIKVRVRSRAAGHPPHRRVLSSGSQADLEAGVITFNLAPTLPDASDDIEVEEVRITLALQHPQTGSLRARLKAPGVEREVELFGKFGSSDSLPDGLGFDYTVFAHSATAGIEEAAPPYVGTFRPGPPYKDEEINQDLLSLAALRPKNSDGYLWTLKLEYNRDPLPIAAEHRLFAALDVFGKPPKLDEAFMGRHPMPAGGPELTWNPQAGEVWLRHWQPDRVRAACYETTTSCSDWRAMPPEVLYYLRREDDQVVRALLRLTGSDHPQGFFRAAWTPDHQNPGG